MFQTFNDVAFTRCGSDGKLKLHEALALMMDCCQFQEYQEAEFCKYLRQNNIVIFLSSIQIDIHKIPRFRDKVRTTVKIYGAKSIFGLRRITMHDQNDELCLISNACGSFIDLNAKKALKMDFDSLPLQFDEAEEMECLPRKIILPSEKGIAKNPITITASMLDINGHLTSSEYFAIAADILPENYSYDRIRIEYKRQAEKNDVLIPVLYMTDNGNAFVDMQNISGISFAAVEFSVIKK